MRKLSKWIFYLFLSVVVFVGLLYICPQLRGMILGGEGNISWVTQQFSEQVRSKNELVVFEAEIQAQETITQDAWLIGTVQKVKIPYTFTIRFVVDLSSIQTYVEDNIITISVSAPQAKYQHLVVDEDGVIKQDWLYPLSAERYAEIKAELEEKLVARYSSYEAYTTAAWEGAVTQLQNLFLSFAHQHIAIENFQIRVIQAETE